MATQRSPPFGSAPGRSERSHCRRRAPRSLRAPGCRGHSRWSRPPGPSGSGFASFERPAGLLFTVRSRYSVRYRPRACIQPWMGTTTRSRYTLKQRYCAAGGRGYRDVTVCPSPFRAKSPRATPPTTAIRARPLPVRSPLLGESLLVSAPGLTDMLKFGPWPGRAREGRVRAPAGPARAARLAARGPASPPEVFEG